MFDIIHKVVKIYYSAINGVELDENLINTLPKERRQYVMSINDDKRKRQSVFVWKLLESALKSEFNFGDEIEFYQKDGEWFVNEKNVKFSLSHSNDMVVVAVSNSRVGVDVELCSSKILKLAKKFPEINDLDDKIEALTLLWTKKESEYKAKVLGNSFSEKVFVLNERYVISACAIDKDAKFICVDIKNLLKGETK